MEKSPNTKVDEYIEAAFSWLTDPDMRDIAIAQIHATLAVAEAIREQTAGIKASLAVIAEYLEP